MKKVLVALAVAVDSPDGGTAWGAAPVGVRHRDVSGNFQKETLPLRDELIAKRAERSEYARESGLEHSDPSERDGRSEDEDQSTAAKGL